MSSLAFRIARFTVLYPGTVCVFAPAAILCATGTCHSDSCHLVACGTGAWVGAVLIAAGIGIYAWCAWDFAVHGQGTGNPHDPPRRLVAHGLYRYSRNPMYVGVLSIIFGEAALFASWPLFLFGACVAAGFHLRVRMYEEPHLRSVFGDDYEAYRARVPRWFG